MVSYLSQHVELCIGEVARLEAEMARLGNATGRLPA